MSFLKEDINVLLRSGTNMDANDLYVTLIAVQGELHNTIVELFGMLCLEHKGAASTNTKQAFSNILASCKYLENVRTLDHGFTKNKLYDTNEDGTFLLRDEINLKILDSMFLFDVLKNVKGFPTFQKNLQRRRRLVSCKQALHQQCCIACNHKCLACDRKECKDDSCHVGEKCNQHPCRNCDEKKELCLLSSSVCCKKCGTCLYCGTKMKFDQNERCDRLRLVQGVDMLKNFRVMLENLTFHDCKLFLDGSRTLPGFPLCRTLSELSDTILEAFKEVLHFVSKPEHLRKQHALSPKAIDWKIRHVSSIFKHKDTETLLFIQQEDIHKMLAFINESRIEPSAEYTSIFNRIEKLNNNDTFKRSKLVHRMLVDDGDVDDKNDDGDGEDEDVEIKVDRHKVTMEQEELIAADSSSSSEDEEEEDEVEREGCDGKEAQKVNTVPEKNILVDENNNNHTKKLMIVKLEERKEGNEVYVSAKEEKDTKELMTRLDEVRLDIKVHEREKHSLKLVVEEICSCVKQIQETHDSSYNTVESELGTISREQALVKTSQAEINKQMQAQLAEIAEKLASIEYENRIANEEQKKEMEEIKLNQKNLFDMLQPKQKGGKKHGILKIK